MNYLLKLWRALARANNIGKTMKITKIYAEHVVYARTSTEATGNRVMR